jgi:hypothetical protein
MTEPTPRTGPLTLDEVDDAIRRTLEVQTYTITSADGNSQTVERADLAALIELRRDLVNKVGRPVLGAVK